VEPHIGISNYERVGECRYELRKGADCCLVRWDRELPRDFEAPHKTAGITQPDGGFAVEVFSTIREQHLEPHHVMLCPGERVDVCGKTVECAP
jgi:hypothetical protein